MKRRQLSEWAFRARTGHWCEHRIGDGSGTRWFDTFTPWRITDHARKYRWCTRCNRTEWV